MHWPSLAFINNSNLDEILLPAASVIDFANGDIISGWLYIKTGVFGCSEQIDSKYISDKLFNNLTGLGFGGTAKSNLL